MIAANGGQFDENSAAGLSFKSGTTGDPKGVLYSHRSNVLHTLMSIQPDALNLSARDTILPAVPMYHANAKSRCGCLMQGIPTPLIF